MFVITIKVFLKPCIISPGIYLRALVPNIKLADLTDFRDPVQQIFDVFGG